MSKIKKTIEDVRSFRLMLLVKTMERAYHWRKIGQTVPETTICSI
ncbi:MAG: hypothetical protein SGI89_06415 [bacterium]|nr:hypothetical protein [bacterium]